MLLNGKSHCPDVVLFNMILHELQSLTLQLNLCRITAAQFRWKGEEILLFLFQNPFPISSFGSFTPWGRAGVGKRLRASVRNFSYFSTSCLAVHGSTQWPADVKVGCQFCPSTPSVSCSSHLFIRRTPKTHGNTQNAVYEERRIWAHRCGYG